VVAKWGKKWDTAGSSRDGASKIKDLALQFGGGLVRHTGISDASGLLIVLVGRGKVSHDLAPCVHVGLPRLLRLVGGGRPQ